MPLIREVDFQLRWTVMWTKDCVCFESRWWKSRKARLVSQANISKSWFLNFIWGWMSWTRWFRNGQVWFQSCKRNQNPSLNPEKWTIDTHVHVHLYHREPCDGLFFASKPKILSNRALSPTGVLLDVFLGTNVGSEKFIDRMSGSSPSWASLRLAEIADGCLHVSWWQILLFHEVL